MKKIIVPITFILFLFLTGCASDSNNGVIVDPESVVGTWQSYNETERITLTLEEDGEFTFIGYGNANEEENIGEVMLREDGQYYLDGNQLTLSLQSVSSSGLDYGDYIKDNLGDLYFYVTIEDGNQKMQLIETDGNVTYDLIKIND